ncbi:MAG: hypothetical protein HGB10_01150 [Coriobacteriia bacterium]|nr:hypothetical protein [Coriobacteriia bacterium]
MYRSSNSYSHIVRTALIIIFAVMFVAVAAAPAFALSKSQKSAIKIIKREAKKKHLKKADVRALLKICKRESNYHRLSRNRSCKGLFQLKTSFGRKYWTNPAWNTRKAIRYIKHRYGTPRAALRHCYRYGWY